ncbi:MAG: 30S ribosome-binding factor RbfA [Candidatus Izemoplasmatales bacterium]|jgi:ribosome-binding factor A|nr:30S ribosome-binding factor RbfA [bacterium]MDZ4196908.1 30S ribosome-binding factor RbfA [Candidatus Izemoplasmatales bacterium]
MPKVNRLETIVQRELSDILRTEVKSNLGFITITGMKITNELSFMYAYYTVLGSDEQKAQTKEALEKAKGFIKNQIAARVPMRKVPELVFKYDQSLDQGSKIDQLIREIK